MTQPIHTPGPFLVEENTLAGFPGNGKNFSITAHGTEIADLPLFHRLVEHGQTADYLEAKANARLLAAAYNAFDSAGKLLGLNAVELAERMQDGGIAKLLFALEECLTHVQGHTTGDHAGRPWLQNARTAIVITRGDAA